MPRILNFWSVFAFVIAVLLAGLVALFTAQGILVWTIGLLYLAYDSWLLARMISLSRAALRAATSAPVSSPSPQSLPTLPILVPARNEAAVLPACLDSLLAQHSPADEICVIDDGSEDSTRALLASRYSLPAQGGHVRSSTPPSLRLWTKPSTGKARSFNEILPACTGDLIVTIDADTVVAPGSLAAFRHAFAADPSLAAGCGILEPRCPPGPFARYFQFFQRFEYLRAFLWRLAWSRLNALVLVSGAFAVYRRDVLTRLQGFDPSSWVEDYELLYRLHRVSGLEDLHWQVRVIPDARAITDAPSRPGQFLRQRSRWFGGFLGTLFAQRSMVGSPRFGGLGRVLLPIKVVDTLLPVFAALAQVSLVVLLLRGHFLTGWVLLLLAAKLAYDLTIHLWAMRLYARWLHLPCPPRWLAASVTASLLEPFFFQPLRYTGALAGWLAFLRNRFSWESQRLHRPPMPGPSQEAA